MLPVTWNIFANDLKIFRLKKDHDFARSKERLNLPEPGELPVVEINLYSQLQTTKSGIAEIGIGTDQFTVKFTNRHTAFFNCARIYDKILERKLHYGWHNLTIKRDTVERMVKQNDNWYRLYMPSNQLEAVIYKDILKLEDIMTNLITACIDKFWRLERSRWEHKHIELGVLDESDPNNIVEYELSVGMQEERLIEDIQTLVEDPWERTHHHLKVGKIARDVLVVKPLLYADSENSKVKIQPVPLNLNEKKVVVEIANLAEAKDSYLKGHDLYLIRNMSRGRGVSFFEESSYYPDFIMWLTRDSSQHIVFIDPKGLVRYGLNERSKVGLHKRIKEVEKHLRKEDPNIKLHAYVISVTPPHLIGGESQPKLSWEEQGVYFLEDEGWAKKLIASVLAN